jgi:hypothetical protein
MAKVYLHTKKQREINWESEFQQFPRVPIVGEYLEMRTESSWYRIQLVVHTPFHHDYEAEVYAVRTINSTAEIADLLRKIGEVE